MIPLVGALHIQPEIAKIVYYRAMYNSVRDKDKREGRENVHYKLVEPDPWLIALAIVMWKGIIQGFAWDVVKINVNMVLDRLRELRVAPPTMTPSTNESTRSKSKTRLGFRWTKYADHGDKQREIFLGLERLHNRASQRGRNAITESASPDALKERLRQADERKKVESLSLPTREELRLIIDPYEESSEEVRELIVGVYDSFTRDLEARLKAMEGIHSSGNQSNTEEIHEEDDD